MRWAPRKVRALDSFCFGLIWCTLFGWNTCLLRKVSIKYAPATLASFSQIITIHHELHRQIGHVDVLMCIFHLHSTLNCLDEGICVARAAWTLIPKTTCKVVIVNISQIKLVWNLMIRNMIWISVCVSKLLCLLSSNSKFLCLLTKLFLSRFRILY